ASMETLSLNAVVILNREYQPLLAYQLDEQQQLLPADNNFFNWTRSEFAQENLLIAEPVNDVLNIGEHAYLVAVSPVLQTDHQGPQAGWLLFFQRVDEQLLTNISNIIRVGLRQIPLSTLDASALMPLDRPL